MAALAALQYVAEAFDPTVGKLMGRQVAGREFLKAWVRHSGADPITGWTHSEEERHAFERQVRSFAPSSPITCGNVGNLDPLRAAGALWLADPSVARFAWSRRWRSQNEWSIVGITHTMCTHAAMDRVVELLRAPIQPWDALICTSSAVKQMVMTLLRAEAEYLNARMGAQRFFLPELPVIPLGVDCDSVRHDPAARARWRAEFGLTDDDVAVLQFGRLAVNGKAHPAPLYLALAEAGRRTRRTLHLILAGKFINAAQEQDFRALAAAAEPQIVTHFVDGGRDDIGGVRSAADIGTLLSDNVQESFGLAPVELMGAGLPVVASDWDGLRDTIEADVTGFRVASLIPPAGAGELLARRYAIGESYDFYVGGIAQTTALDIAQAASAFAALIVDHDRRRAMGRAGAERARGLYDWTVVIAAYRDLLAELEKVRRTASELVPRRNLAPAEPGRMDPFAAFVGHASAVIGEDMLIAAAPDCPSRVADVLGGQQMTMINPATIPSAAALDAIMDVLRRGDCTLGSLRAHFPEMDFGLLIAGACWLLKFGFAVRPQPVAAPVA